MRASMRTAGRDWALIDVGVAATELSSPYPCRDIVALFMTGIHPRYATLMSTDSTYEETLPCGGRLRIFRDNWEIRYFFSGRDLRYKSTFKTIPGEEVEQYIQAYQKNWIDFIALKAATPKGNNVVKYADADMTISIGAFEGVFLVAFHMPINSDAALESMVGGYRYAQTRVDRIQAFLKTL